MNLPHISVIVPVYNTSPWLRKCLDSICAQSYRNLEILCINDGSTDNSAEILEEYAAKDTRIKVLTQQNAGLSAARNTGLAHATGEWVTGVDSDDYLYPGVYEQAVAYCREGVNVVFFGVQREDECGQVLPQNNYFNLPTAGEYEMAPQLAAQLNVCFVSKLWRRSMIEEQSLRFPVGLVNEDEAMYWTAAPYMNRIAVCAAVGYAYLQRRGSIMNEEGLNLLKRRKRLIPILEFVHKEYEKRGLLQTSNRDYLNLMFVLRCSYTPGEYSSALRQLGREVVEKCGMKYADYRLENLFDFEKRGVITIHRKEHMKLYKLFGLPIWVTLYTPNYNVITLPLLLSHLKRRLFRK